MEQLGGTLDEHRFRTIAADGSNSYIYNCRSVRHDTCVGPAGDGVMCLIGVGRYCWWVCHRLICPLCNVKRRSNNFKS